MLSNIYDMENIEPIVRKFPSYLPAPLASYIDISHIRHCNPMLILRRKKYTYTFKK